MKKESKTPEQVAAEKHEEQRLVSLIGDLTKRVPSSANSWSYQTAVAFKKAVGAATSEIRKSRLNLDKLRSVCNELNVFYQ